MANYLNYEVTWDRILNRKYAVTEEEISFLADRTMPFEITTDHVLRLLIEKYQDKFPKDFQLKDYRSEICTDLLLGLFDFLSIETSEMYNSERQFLSPYGSSPKTPDENGPYIYSSQRRLHDALEELFPPESEPCQHVMFKGLPYLEKKLPTIYESRSILEDNKLFDFIYSHMQIEEDYSGSNLIHHYHFNKEGSFFLNVVLKAANSLNIPYTVKGQNRLTMGSLNNLSLHLWESFNSSACEGKERLLFLYNAENIFELSFLKTIAKSYNSLYSKLYSGKLDIYHFGSQDADSATFTPESLAFLQCLRFSLCLVNDLKGLPWNSLKPTLWDIYADKYFEIGCKYADSQNLQNPIVSILRGSRDTITGETIFPESPGIIADAAEEMTDCFFYIMLRLYHCLDSITAVDKESSAMDIAIARENMNTLKTDLFYDLRKPSLNDFTWSMLKEKDKKKIKIPNLCSRYLETLILNVFYATDFPLSDSRIDHLYDSTSLPYLMSEEHLF